MILPQLGWHVASTEVNAENIGVEPDLVPWMPPPEGTAADRESRLERGAETLLSGLENDPRYGAW